MIDTQDKFIRNCFLCYTMEQCSRQCIRRTLFAVMVGVSPIVICLLFIGLARLILYRLEIAYSRRHKISYRRSSLFPYHSGRLALSYTPVSHAELQRIIRGEYIEQQTRDSFPPPTNTNSNVRKAPRFIRSILPRRESSLAPSSILANLVIRRNALDASPVTTAFTPVETPLQPTFSVINEQNKHRPSVITITKESVETTTVSSLGQNASESNFTLVQDTNESEPTFDEPLMAATKTMTTTVVVEEFHEFHSVSSIPCALTLLSSIAENDTDKNLEINNNTDYEYH